MNLPVLDPGRDLAADAPLQGCESCGRTGLVMAVRFADQATFLICAGCLPIDVTPTLDSAPTE